MPVLLIEDDAATRTVFTELLLDKGYKVLAAEHGQAALDLLAVTQPLPRLILLDLVMPVMNGPEFIKALRTKPAFKDIPIILMSAGEDLLQDVRNLPVAAFVTKPIRFDEFLTTIAHHYPTSAR